MNAEFSADEITETREKFEMTIMNFELIVVNFKFGLLLNQVFVLISIIGVDG